MMDLIKLMMLICINLNKLLIFNAILMPFMQIYSFLYVNHNANYSFD